MDKSCNNCKYQNFNCLKNCELHFMEGWCNYRMWEAKVERICATCDLVNKFVCGVEKGLEECSNKNYQHWRHKVDKIQISEEQAIEMWKNSEMKQFISEEYFVNKLKQAGYIKKDIVEEAEEMLVRYEKDQFGNENERYNYIWETMDLCKKAIQYLKERQK